MKYLIIFCLFLCIRADDDVILKEPICNIPLNPTDKKIFDDFAIKEECMFQRFMDKRRQIDCIIQKNDILNCDEECEKEIMEISDEIYQARLDVACVCENPRNIAASYFFENERDKITTLTEYIDCWTHLWEFMTDKVIEKLEELLSKTNDQNVKDQCKKYGDENQARCP